MRSVLCIGLGILILSIGSGCVTSQQVAFPPSREVFMTTGDGDIQKPYEPVGQLMYHEEGFRLGFPIIGLIPIADVDPEVALQKGISDKVRTMGGDSVINLRMDWTPPANGFIGIGAKGGAITIYGTVIKR